jgi:hypothetical protein
MIYLIKLSKRRIKSKKTPGRRSINKFYNRIIIPMYQKFSALLFLAVFSLLFMGINACQNDSLKRKRAAKTQLEMYPGSTLQDIYKSFFQDEFGPGHLLGSTINARRYFDYELSIMTSRKRYDAEPCGTGINYYRVPMDLVKDNLVSADAFFQAFAESAENFTIPDVDSWKQKREENLTDIVIFRSDIPGFEKDSILIAHMLENGEVVTHHSDFFKENFDPHYRIMTKSKWIELQSEIKN